VIRRRNRHARELSDLADEYAVGIHDADAAADERPSQRKDLGEIVFAGDFTPQ